MRWNPFPWTADIADLLRVALPYVPATVDGEAVHRVPLSNRPDTFATLDKAGYDLLVARGVDFLILSTVTGGNSYVQAQRPGSLHRWDTVARLITGAGKGQLVRYANGDRLDLRHSNLHLHQTKVAA